MMVDTISTSQARGARAERRPLPPSLIAHYVAAWETNVWQTRTGFFTIPADVLFSYHPLARDALLVSFGREFIGDAQADIYGTVLSDIEFRSSDATGLYPSCIDRIAADRLTHAEAAEAQAQSTAETIQDRDELTADLERPISAAWLAQAYSSLFRPSVQEDIDLPDDPDELPVF